MIKYQINTVSGSAELEHLANNEGWNLKQVLNTHPSPDGRIIMCVLLTKTIPDNLSGLMVDVEPKPQPVKRGRPRKVNNEG